MLCRCLFNVMNSHNIFRLRKAFSLNDRFRFRRELFGNSDAEMNDTLNLVEAMLNREEACDYFYHDLQWDRDNPSAGIKAVGPGSVSTSMP